MSAPLLLNAAAQGAARSEAFGRLLQAALDTWHKLVEMVMTQPVLKWALIAMAMVLLGGRIRSTLPTLGGLMRFFGNLGLMVALLATLAGLVDLSALGISSASLPEGLRQFLPAAEGEPVVEGKETRIPLARDGHFWVKAQVNGVPVRFLVDTGATLTTLSPDAAREVGVVSRRTNRRIELRTANGSSTGEIVVLKELRAGNIAARRIEAVIAPGIGETNVLGMNFLTQLEGWRVEGKVMVLVPHHPVASPSTASTSEAG